MTKIMTNFMTFERKRQKIDDRLIFTKPRKPLIYRLFELCGNLTKYKFHFSVEKLDINSKKKINLYCCDCTMKTKY